MKSDRSKPVAPAVQHRTIPAELKNVPQWVCWQFKQRPDKHGKWTKPPISCRDGRQTDPTDPQSWSTFECALKFSLGRTLVGIGFVFTDADPYSGIDLDDCRDPATGNLEPWAQEIVQRIDSYTEVSPSGKGVKIFVKGKLPVRSRKRKGNIELYSRARYFTVTGLSVPGTPLAIELRQDELVQLYHQVFDKASADGEPAAPSSVLSDEEVIDQGSQGKNGPKFSRLWQGDTSGYESHSEADLALCRMLVHVVGPVADRIERIFSRSELARRDKWEREDYRRKTIELAIGNASEDSFIIRGNRLNKNKQDYTGNSYTGEKREKGFTQISPEEEKRSVQMAIDLAEDEGKLPDWQATFNLARRLRSISESSPEPFKSAVAAYCEKADRPSEEFWYCFLLCWDKVRFAEDQDVFAWAVAEAASHPYVLANSQGEKYQMVASIAWHLACHAAPNPFWLPRERLAKLLSTYPNAITNIVRLLERDHIIECVKDSFSYVEKRAKEYRFVADAALSRAG